MLRRKGASAGGFTLVELLVVISILALLIAILVPSLRGAKRVSKRVACGGNLRSIGQAMRMYLNDSNDFLPVVEAVPSIPIDEDHPRPSIATVLRPYLEKNFQAEEDPEEELKREGNEAFHCPADIPGKINREGENQDKSYYETEQSSYRFNTFLHMMRDDVSFTDGNFDKPVKLSEIVNSERAKRFFGSKPAEEDIWLLRDYIAFHGEAGQEKSTNYLYLDGRVADLER
ncbi:MAG: type II secretion system protein [Phycisphaerales bacterium]|nr:type II secretion system protein [Phycisphaerales bacterium]